MAAALRRIESEIIRCRRCPRLVAHREAVARTRRHAYRDQAYWGRPVPGFGDADARLVVVGLAPGAHGSNRTGRMFTGDASGDFLYAALHDLGFASQALSVSRGDGLTLRDTFITAAARCAPPGNRPNPEELATCRPYLVRELRALERARVWVALGRIGFEAILAALPELGLFPERDAGAPGNRRPRFAHGALIRLQRSQISEELDRSHATARGKATARDKATAAPVILCSYHPSRQNTQTGRLTRSMFRRVFAEAARILDEDGPAKPARRRRAGPAVDGTGATGRRPRTRPGRG